MSIITAVLTAIVIAAEAVDKIKDAMDDEDL